MQHPPANPEKRLGIAHRTIPGGPPEGAAMPDGLDFAGSRSRFAHIVVGTDAKGNDAPHTDGLR